MLFVELKRALQFSWFAKYNVNILNIVNRVKIDVKAKVHLFLFFRVIVIQWREVFFGIYDAHKGRARANEEDACQNEMICWCYFCVLSRLK